METNCQEIFCASQRKQMAVFIIALFRTPPSPTCQGLKSIQNKDLRDFQAASDRLASGCDSVGRDAGFAD